MSEARPSRRQSADVRRKQLLDAAESVLLEHGLRHTTVADVAGRAGVAKGTTYLYFGSKDELLAGLRARYLQRFAEALAPAPGRSARERIHALVVGLVEFSSANHRLHHVLFHEAGVSEDDEFTAVRDALADLLAEGRASGELAVADVDLTASFLVHGVHGALVHSLHRGGRRPGRRRVGRAVADLVDRALSG